MLFLISSVIVLAAIVLLAVFVKRQVANSLIEQARTHELPEPRFRPLFEPTEEELLEAERIEAARVAELREEEKSRERAKKLAKFDELRQNWAKSPNRTSTVEVLYEASRSASGDIFWDTCESVLTAWRAGRIDDLSSNDLAQLLESHFWLLPENERTPGVSFRLKEEIAGLRSRFEESK